MTTSEQKSVDQLCKLVSELRTENAKFREDVANQMLAINSKVDSKHLPITLERDVLQAINSSITKALSESLSGFNSPLVQFGKNVVTKYQAEIESIFDAAIKEGIKTDEFKARSREVLLSKIAKTVISGIDGGIDKTINAMKNDIVFRGRLAVAVNDLIEEFLKK